MKLSLTAFLLTLFFIFSITDGVSAGMKEHTVNLPKIIGVWARSDSSQIITSKNIFKYMNGAGELYLGYRFNHMEVYEYTAENQPNILVELYVMETSDDAFGLLSLDWGGEPVTLRNSSETAAINTIAPSSRALYGRGLLRIWSNNLYARIMAYNETPASKKAVLSLGRTIAANCEGPPRPKLLNILSPTIDSDWTLRVDRIAYFRSCLVFNSLYYLSHQNILNLNLTAEAVTAPYENNTNTENQKRVQFLFVKYANAEQARQALNHFHEAYLPERKSDLSSSNPQTSWFFNIEDGWLGYQLFNECVAFVFECPNEESARIIINQLDVDLLRKEIDYGE